MAPTIQVSQISSAPKEPVIVVSKDPVIVAKIAPKVIVLKTSKGIKANVSVPKLSAEDEKRRVLREIEESESALAEELFGVSSGTRDDDDCDEADGGFDLDGDNTLNTASKPATTSKSGSSKSVGTILEEISFKSADEAILFAAQFAKTIKEKTSARLPVLLAFLREFIKVGVDGLKIDDLNDIKNHLTNIYNFKKTAKLQTKSATQAAATKPGATAISQKKVGQLNMFDAYGNEESGGRGVAGGKLYGDDDGVDFM